MNEAADTPEQGGFFIAPPRTGEPGRVGYYAHETNSLPKIVGNNTSRQPDTIFKKNP